MTDELHDNPDGQLPADAVDEAIRAFELETHPGRSVRRSGRGHSGRAWAARPIAGRLVPVGLLDERFQAGRDGCQSRRWRFRWRRC